MLQLIWDLIILLGLYYDEHLVKKYIISRALIVRDSDQCFQIINICIILTKEYMKVGISLFTGELFIRYLIWHRRYYVIVYRIWLPYDTIRWEHSNNSTLQNRFYRVKFASKSYRFRWSRCISMFIGLYYICYINGTPSLTPY